MLYGKKPNPFETHAGRVRTVGLVVKSCGYSCIACVAFCSLDFTLALLDLQRWEPFALSGLFVIIALLSLMGMTAPPRPPEADGLGFGTVPVQVGSHFVRIFREMFPVTPALGIVATFTVSFDRRDDPADVCGAPSRQRSPVRYS